MDRVMTRGFAYAKGRKYDTGMFKSRRAMICTTTHRSAVGYADHSAFTSQFKAKNRITPAQYRAASQAGAVRP